MISIAPVTTQDFDVLFEIEQTSHLVPWTLGTLKNNQGENYVNLKILQEQKIVGFAICQKVLDEATLFNLAISPNYQGQGLGKCLLKYLMDELRKQDVLALWLEVRASNEVAQKLYFQCGFNKVDERKNYYPTITGDRENAIIMACSL